MTPSITRRSFLTRAGVAGCVGTDMVAVAGRFPGDLATRQCRSRWPRASAISLSLAAARLASTAVMLARTGARVTIYARELPPFTRSSWATGVFTPDSRIAV